MAAVEERKIFDVCVKALFLGLLFLFGVYSNGQAEPATSTLRIDIKNSGKHIDTRARLLATRKIYRDLLTSRLWYDEEIPHHLKSIINNIFYINYISKIHIKGFKLLSRKRKEDRLEYTYSYKKVDLPKIRVSKFLSEIGCNINKNKFKINPVYAMELSLNFPNKIPFKSALNVWNKKYKGFMKYALDGVLISDIAFLRQAPIKVTASQVPKGLVDLLLLNDTVPFNLQFCEALTNGLAKKELIKLLEKVVHFCLKSPRVDRSMKNLENMALEFSFVERRKLSGNKNVFNKIREEKELFEEKYFDIDNFHSISAIINSLGQLPIVLTSIDCDIKTSDIGNLVESFEKSHSLVVLGYISDWFSKNNSPSLHGVLEAQLNESVVRSKKNNACKNGGSTVTPSGHTVPSDTNHRRQNQLSQ